MLFPTVTNAATVGFPDGSLDTNRFAAYLATARVPLPPDHITLYHDDCPMPNLISCVNFFWNGAVYLTGDDWYKQRVFLHEVGHLYDHGMDAGSRRAFAALLSDTRGWHETGGTPLVEQFADYYAACAQWGTNLPKSFDRKQGIIIEGYAKPMVRFRTYIKLCKVINHSTYVGHENSGWLDN